MKYFVILEIEGKFPGQTERTRFAVPEDTYDFLYNSLIEKANKERKGSP